MDASKKKKKEVNQIDHYGTNSFFPNILLAIPAKPCITNLAPNLGVNADQLFCLQLERQDRETDIDRQTERHAAETERQTSRETHGRWFPFLKSLQSSSPLCIAYARLYESLCPSVGQSVGPLVTFYFWGVFQANSEI